MSLHMPLTLHDLLLSFVGVVGGYTLGVLQSVAADQRDRWKARNRILYTLFQIHHEIRASNPREILPLFERFIRKRLGKDGENVTIPPELRSAQRWLGFFGHEDKWTDCCTFPLWEEQIRCEDRDETMPPRSRPG